MISSFLRYINFLIAAIILFSIVIFSGLYVWLNNDLPQLPDNLKHINLSLPTEIYSADGELIKSLGKRNPVGLEDIAPHFLNAIVAVEDSDGKVQKLDSSQLKAKTSDTVSVLNNGSSTNGSKTIIVQRQVVQTNVAVPV